MMYLLFSVSIGYVSGLLNVCDETRSYPERQLCCSVVLEIAALSFDRQHTQSITTEY